MSSAPICHFCAAAGVLMGDVRGVCDGLTRSAMFSRENRRDSLIASVLPYPSWEFTGVSRCEDESPDGNVGNPRLRKTPLKPLAGENRRNRKSSTISRASLGRCPWDVDARQSLPRQSPMSAVEVP